MMTRKKDPSGAYFSEYRLNRAFALLLILFLVRVAFAMSFGLISEVTHSNAADALLARLDEITVFRTYSTAGHSAPEWLQDVSLIETVEFLCYLYCVVVAFFFDLLHSPFPQKLPAMLGLEFLLFCSVRFFEMLGGNLIWVIVFGIVVAALGILGLKAILSSELLAVFWFSTSIGSVIAGVISGVLLPIVCAAVLVVSILQFFAG